LHKNNSFPELELGCVLNSTIYSINFTMKLLYGEVSGAELKKNGRRAVATTP
jgi:hypothetical protein